MMSPTSCINESSAAPSSPESSPAWSYERLQRNRVAVRSPQPFNPCSVELLRPPSQGLMIASTMSGLSNESNHVSPSTVDTTPLVLESHSRSPGLPSPDLCPPSTVVLPDSPSVPSTSSSETPLPTRDRDPLRLSRFLSFPSHVASNGATVNLFDGLLSRNAHEIRLLRSGYYGIRLHNMNEAAWDGLYLGIGRMKAVAEFEVIPPPLELLNSSRMKRVPSGKQENAYPPIIHNVDNEACRELIAKSEGRDKAVEVRGESGSPDPNEARSARDRCRLAPRSSSPTPLQSPIPSSPLESLPDRRNSVNDKNEEGSSFSFSREVDSMPECHHLVPRQPESSSNEEQFHMTKGDGNNSVPLTSAVVFAHRVDDEAITKATDSRMIANNGNRADVNEEDQSSVSTSRSDEIDDITDGSADLRRKLTKDATAESISVITGKGALICRAQQEKVVYLYVSEAQSSLKLQVHASLTLGMRLRCIYDLLYCGSPKVLPLNPVVPFLRNASILCLDGGGILGISSLKILERLELELQKELKDSTVRIKDCFDMICGTSTGGIISLGLLTGLSIKEMISMWASLSSRIFEGNRTLFSGIIFEGYDVGRLKQALVEGLGNRFMNTYTQPYCFVTSTDVKHNPYELFLLRNYTHSHLAKHEYRGGSAIPVWTAAWATAAAPTYLKGPNPAEIENMGLIIHPEVQLCDGAMKANNPTMVALEEAARLSGKRLQHFIESDLDVLLSIGTGQPTLRQTIEKTGIVSTFQILVNSGHLLTSSTHVHRDVLHWLGDHEDKYFRFNVPGIGDLPLDAVDKSSHDLILKATNDYLTDEKYYDMKRLVKTLSYRLSSSYLTSRSSS